MLQFLSKKRVLFVLGCCALIAARKMLFAVTPPGGPAVANGENMTFAPGTDTKPTGTPTPEVTEEQVKAYAKNIDIPYSEIASILEDDTILDLIKLIPSIGSDIAISSKSLAQMMKGLEQFQSDLTLANATRKKFQSLMLCTKASAHDRQNNATLKVLCPQLGCTNRAECLKKAISSLQIMLRPFIDDLFVGYEKNGKKVDGLAYNALDIIHQSGSKQELDAIVKPLQTVLKVLEILEKIVQIGSQVNAQKPAEGTNK